jgi:hypothetical protein
VTTPSVRPLNALTFPDRVVSTGFHMDTCSGAQPRASMRPSGHAYRGPCAQGAIATLRPSLWATDGHMAQKRRSPLGAGFESASEH